MTHEELPESDRVGCAPHPREIMSLYGHSEAEARFLEAFRSDRLHHAWLIIGSRGIGKATLAWRIARYILIDARLREESRGISAGLSRDSLEVPGGHLVTRRMIALSEPGMRLIRRPYDKKSKRLRKFITVGEVRRLKSFFELTSTDGLPRVVIIDSADEMNASASNALLKVLEEPPENSYFFLISHSPSCLLPTVRSRCRTLKCSPLSKDDITKVLNHAARPFSVAKIDSLAELACGSVGEAVQLLDESGLETYTQLVELVAEAPGMARHRVIELAASCEGKEQEGRYDITIRLVLTLLARLASSGISGPFPAEAAPGEARMLTRLSGELKAAQAWAEAHDELCRLASTSREVNIDPFSVMHDMLVRVDRTAVKVANSKS